MNTPASNGKAKPPANVLYRSRIEICRILEALAKDSTSISAEISSGMMFVSHIFLVDQHMGHFVISYCANKALNNRLSELPSVKFTARHHDAHIEFEASNPTETQLDGQPAIRFALPNSLILGNRREYQRIPVPAEASLRCIADEDGFLPFEAQISDITHDGLGGMVYSSDINIEPGTILNGCRIIIPGGNAVVVDLIVKNIKLITLADGTTANRVGLRFIQRPDEITELINFFIYDLDKK